MAIWRRNLTEDNIDNIDNIDSNPLKRQLVKGAPCTQSVYCVTWSEFFPDDSTTDSPSISRNSSIDFLLEIRLLFVHFPQGFFPNGKELLCLNLQVHIETDTISLSLYLFLL